MKPFSARFFKVLLFAVAAGVSATVAAAEGAPISAQEAAMRADEIMQNFYLSPQPEKIDEFLELLSGVAPVRLRRSLGCNTTFLGEAFRRYPQQLPKWAKLPGRDDFRETLFRALSYADSDEARQAARALPLKIRLRVPFGVRNVRATPVEKCTPATVDACWGGFFGSGDVEYVDTVIRAAFQPEKPGERDLTRRAALWSLLHLSGKHPRIETILKERLRQAPEGARNAVAEETSEKRQRELLGEVLITDEKKDENDTEKQKRKPFSAVRESTRLKPEFFAAVKAEKPSTQSDYIARLKPPVVREVRRRFPEVSEAEAEKIALGHITHRDIMTPRKSPVEEDSFLNFYAVCKYADDHRLTSRQRKMFVGYALKLAAKYPGEPVVAQMVYRELRAAAVFGSFDPKMLKNRRVHPYLELLLSGEYHHSQAWKQRGGGYADTVSTHGWQGFREHLNKARTLYERAWREYPRLPEAPARMVGIAGASSGCDGEEVVWLKRALSAQKDYYDAVDDFAWYSRPRWVGSAAQLLADAKAFLNQREDDPLLAYNGLFLLQTFLSEIPFIDSIRYFRGEKNYAEVKGLFDELEKVAPPDHVQILFLGAAALLADDHETADQVAASLKAESADAVILNPRRIAVPMIEWIDFPALNRALNRTKLKSRLFRAVYYQNANAAAELLKTAIAQVPDRADKQALIDFYILLKGDLDRTYFRRPMPAFIRLCAEFDGAARQLKMAKEIEDKMAELGVLGTCCDEVLRKLKRINRKAERKVALIREVVAMGTDVNVLSPLGTIRPLYYALRSEESGELLSILLAAKADPYALLEGQHTPLDYAVHRRFPPERIREFLESGVDPNRKYNRTFTPLHAAFRNLEGTKLLVEFGAKLNEVSEYGHTPLDLAEKMGSAEVARYLRSKGAKHASELE